MKSILNIGIIGDYDENKPSHKATIEALRHSAEYNSIDIEVNWLPTIELENNIDLKSSGFDAFFAAPGSPYKSYKGAISAIRFARVNDYPFIGTCGGFQHAVMEYAQNVLGIAEVYHQEYNPDASDFFITALSCSLMNTAKKIHLKKGFIVQSIYEEDLIEERYNCNFGLNVRYQDEFEKNGFRAAGVDENGEARIFELPNKRFYIATLFQPQLSSTQDNPHVLITEFLKAAKAFNSSK